MSEKTAEEKLRQALEGSTASTSDSEQPKNQKKPRPSRARPKPSRTAKAANLGERLDSFMDDFERRIEQSISAVKSPSETPEHHEKPGRVKISAEHKPETSRRVRARPKAHPAPLYEPVQEVPKPETLSAPEIESAQEEIIPDVMPLEEEYEPAEDLPDIPVIEAAEIPQDEDGNLPDIPLISADDDNDDIDDAAEIFADELEEISASADNEISGHEEETEAPDEESQMEFQEAELQEAQYDEDEFADLDTDIADDSSDVFTDEPLDEEPAIIDTEEEAEDAPPYDIESDEAGIFSDDDNDDTDETPGDFSPSADVVLNVDDEIPHISPPAETVNDPEAESAPVTVTMPESTKTAEDKLMADIAEAMTGNPLSLDSQETNGIYNLPENFFTDGANSGESPQSAEDKLKANIVQALSESPINAAHENASQSLEQDINPFEELSIPDTLTPAENESHDEDLPTEETNDEPEILPQENNDDLFPETITEESPSQDFDGMAGNESETQNDDDDENLNDPFTIPDFGDDDTDSVPDLESSEDETKFFADAFADDTEESQEADSESDLAPEPETESESPSAFDTETESTPEIFTKPEDEPESEPVTLSKDFTEPETESSKESQPAEPEDDMPFPIDEPENTPLTEQEALIAMVTQEFGAGENTADDEPEFDIDKKQEEAQPRNNMPEQSLLNDETPGDFEPEENNDAFDVSALGELGQAATFADDSEDFSASPATVTEMITQPDAGIIHNPEDDHKEKTMNIREKLASRKNGNSDGAAPAAKSKSGGLLLTVLTALLAVIGGLILWQLMQVSDKLTSLAMNSPGYESVSGSETPSYDYAIDFILDPNISDRMSQRGRAGWQVVGSRRTQDSTTGQYGYEFIFMRRTPGR